jgi:urease accessory protein UreF
MEDAIEDGNADDPAAARRYLEVALRQTAACAQQVPLKEVA